MIDGAVSPIKIKYYNSLLRELCDLHNVLYNVYDQLGRSLLNGSDLHLNKPGDRTLGGTFCSFVKPAISQTFFKKNRSRWSSEQITSDL